MRKLEYLRSAVRKCKTMDDVDKIQLPEEFKLSDDVDNCPYLCAIPVEKNGKDWLVIFIVHSRIVEREVLARYGIFGTKREDHLVETYMIPVSKKFKFEPPTKIDANKDYSNWGMTKEGTLVTMPPLPDDIMECIPLPFSVPIDEDRIIEWYAMTHNGKMPSRSTLMEDEQCYIGSLK